LPTNKTSNNYRIFAVGLGKRKFIMPCYKLQAVQYFQDLAIQGAIFQALPCPSVDFADAINAIRKDWQKHRAELNH